MVHVANDARPVLDRSGTAPLVAAGAVRVPLCRAAPFAARVIVARAVVACAIWSRQLGQKKNSRVRKYVDVQAKCGCCVSAAIRINLPNPACDEPMSAVSHWK